MELVKEFLTQCGIHIYSDIQEDMDMEFVEDNTNFVVVDGEEGDYGYTKYSLDGKVVAYFVCFGGDKEDYVFTPHGVKTFREIARNVILRMIDNLERPYTMIDIVDDKEQFVDASGKPRNYSI